MCEICCTRLIIATARLIARMLQETFYTIGGYYENSC